MKMKITHLLLIVPGLTLGLLVSLSLYDYSADRAEWKRLLNLQPADP